MKAYSVSCERVRTASGMLHMQFTSSLAFHTFAAFILSIDNMEVSLK